MKACDRHGRFEGSLKAADFRLLLINEAATDEERMEGKHVKLEQELCASCVEDMVKWYRESHPAALFVVPPLTDDEAEATLAEERRIWEENNGRIPKGVE